MKMAVHQTQMLSFIADEVSKVRGRILPRRAGMLEHMLVRKVKCSRLHPNPNDEFCFPEIGPCESIVSRYEQDFRILRDAMDDSRYLDTNAADPLEVQKIQPDGYMILNGHHRWIAAIRAGMTRLPVRIVNLTDEKSLRKMLSHAKHDRRVTLDLEEVVFSADRDGQLEKPLRFPFGNVYRKRVRLGIPALFSSLISQGYDIWLYSSGYESVDYIRELLKLHHTQVTGIITGTARKAPKDSKARETMENLISAKYARTVHIDNNAALCVDSRTGSYQEFPLSGDCIWSAKVMEIMKAVEKHA